MAKMTAQEIAATTFYQTHSTRAMAWYVDECRAAFHVLMDLALEGFDSPLEAAFFAWWIVVDERGGHIDMDLHTHVRVEVGGQVYRPDFTFAPKRPGEFASLRAFPRVAIELDGHEFHEKTKEQVAYRNKRDRDLQSEGWLVLHVSGSEFNRDPLKVVQELRQTVREMFARAQQAERPAVMPNPPEMPTPTDGTNSDD